MSQQILKTGRLIYDLQCIKSRQKSMQIVTSMQLSSFANFSYYGLFLLKAVL